MKTEWDYTSLAEAYLKRPDYSIDAIESMLSIAQIKPGNKICDIGAGVAHLTLMLVSRGMDVVAVEPNDAMRAGGIERTNMYPNVCWFEGTAESTGQKDKQFDLITIGSSFNVCDRPKALQEVARILKKNAWFACMWNHRKLDDPIQKSIEQIIKNEVLGYGYGARREDQSEIIESSGLFHSVIQVNAKVIHTQTIDECIQAWRSHATLQRQAGDRFQNVINSIEVYLRGLQSESIQVPYTTNIWLAQLR